MVTESPTSDEQWTVRKILDWTVGFLKERGSDTPRLDAEVLLAHARKCRRIQLYTQYDEPLTEVQRSIMRQLVKRRAAAEPVAYLVGYREFFSLNFLVQPGVLIPRPDTEILVMAALDIAKTLPNPRILDVCTGTACIPIAIAVNHAAAQLVAVELMPIPFEVAGKNIEKHQLQNRIQLLQGDLFAPLSANDKFDVITSNPPYITTSEMLELDADVKDHEPHEALVAGADGLDVIRRLIVEAPQYLKNTGCLMLELDPKQADAVSQLMKSGGFSDVQVKNDLSGQARVVQGKLDS